MTFGAAILAPAGPRLTADERAFFAETNPFGFIVFDRNLQDPNEIRDLTADLRASVGRNAPIFIDQEGGRVQRLRPPLARNWEPPLDDQDRFGANAPEAAYLRARVIAHELRNLGIDGNCIPTLDIATDQTHPVLRNRCYGRTKDEVVQTGLSVSQGLLSGGVLPVIKHMPGHGRALFDSHVDLPRIDALAEDLSKSDFAAFRPFAEHPLGMTAHLIFSALDDQPATISTRMIDLIRTEIGFQGLLMTDDISMEALDGTPGERATRAREAGCDIVLHCNGDLSEMRDIMASAGTTSQAETERAHRALAWRTTPYDIDVDTLMQRFADLAA